MAQRSLSLQDHFLNSVRRARTPVTIFLVKGVKLTGMILWFDSFSILLRRQGASQLVYKHSISTIMPADRPADFVISANQPERPGKDSGAPLQDLFLAAAVRECMHMTMFLANGVMLQGTVGAFDQYCVLLQRGAQIQLVYKHALSTLQPDEALNLDGAGDDDASARTATEGEGA